MNTTHEDTANRVMAVYDGQVRRNDDWTFPAVRNVAECTDGLYGALGEVFDTASECRVDTDDDGFRRALESAFVAYRAGLRIGLGMGDASPIDGRAPYFPAFVRGLMTAVDPLSPDERPPVDVDALRSSLFPTVAG